jgi:hypothetical protein
VILCSIEHNTAVIITVRMSRQSNKNQLSAIVEAFLLFSRKEGTIIKAAPTLNPQLISSRRRLMQMFEYPFCNRRVWTSYTQIGWPPQQICACSAGTLTLDYALLSATEKVLQNTIVSLVQDFYRPP